MGIGEYVRRWGRIDIGGATLLRVYIIVAHAAFGMVAMLLVVDGPAASTAWARDLRACKLGRQQGQAVDEATCGL